ncbi:MAG: prepilin peptidase [Christensenellales bacterium]
MIWRIAVSALLGGMIGEGMRRLTMLLIQKRTGQPVHSLLLSSRWSPFAWIAIGALGCGVIALLVQNIVSSIEYMGIFLVLTSLAVTDISIRKIPNELLLVLLVLKLGGIVTSGSFHLLLPSLVGLIAGLVIFLFPASMGLGIGMGDIKLAAVVGFCLGLVGVLQAALIMAMVMAIYFLYLILTKRGDLKTKIAIGPPLSFGMMATLLFPLVIAV